MIVLTEDSSCYIRFTNSAILAKPYKYMNYTLRYCTSLNFLSSCIIIFGITYNVNLRVIFKVVVQYLKASDNILLQVGAIAPQNLEPLLQTIHECLSNTDWATRKAAADTLSALALNSSNLVAGGATSTLTVLEASRFDKVPSSSNYVM